MIIYNNSKTKVLHNYNSSVKRNQKRCKQAKRLQLTEENKEFLKSLNFKLKKS